MHIVQDNILFLDLLDCWTLQSSEPLNFLKEKKTIKFINISGTKKLSLHCCVSLEYTFVQSFLVFLYRIRYIIFINSFFENFQ